MDRNLIYLQHSNLYIAACQGVSCKTRKKSLRSKLPINTSWLSAPCTDINAKLVKFVDWKQADAKEDFFVACLAKRDVFEPISALMSLSCDQITPSWLQKQLIHVMLILPTATTFPMQRLLHALNTGWPVWHKESWAPSAPCIGVDHQIIKDDWCLHD